MINDSLNNLNQFISPDVFESVNNIIQTSVKKPQSGRYDIIPDELYINVEFGRTKPPDLCKIESHKLFADIHIILNGRIGKRQ